MPAGCQVIGASAGNMMFVVLHEMAHAIISDMEIPILAREEDVADSFGHTQTFRSIQLLEIIARHAADQFVWSAPFTLEMEICGFVNARGVAKTRKLTLCRTSWRSGRPVSSPHPDQ
jgi:hypothetical protein